MPFLPHHRALYKTLSKQDKALYRREHPWKKKGKQTEEPNPGPEEGNGRKNEKMSFCKNPQFIQGIILVYPSCEIGVALGTAGW